MAVQPLSRNQRVIQNLKNFFKSYNPENNATGPSYKFGPGSEIMVRQLNNPNPSFLPPPINQPITRDGSRRLSVEQYQGKSNTPVPLPSQSNQDLLWEFMPKEATPSAVVLAGENGTKWDLNAINVNNDERKSKDYGLAQNNDKTFGDMLLAGYGPKFEKYGIKTIEDTLGDARKSIALMSLMREYEKAPRNWADKLKMDAGEKVKYPDWARWYGWQNNGYNIDPSQSIDSLANQYYGNGKPIYEQLQKFLLANPDRVEVGR